MQPSGTAVHSHLSSHQVHWNNSLIQHLGRMRHPHLSRHQGQWSTPRSFSSLVQWYNTPIQPSSTMRHPEISRHLVRQYTAIYPAIRYGGTPPYIQTSGTVVQRTHQAIKYNERHSYTPSHQVQWHTAMYPDIRYSGTTNPSSHQVQ